MKQNSSITVIYSVDNINWKLISIITCNLSNVFSLKYSQNFVKKSPVLNVVAIVLSLKYLISQTHTSNHAIRVCRGAKVNEKEIDPLFVSVWYKSSKQWSENSQYKKKQPFFFRILMKRQRKN